MMKLACSVVIATTFIGLRTGPSAEGADRSSLPAVLDSFLTEEVHPTASERVALLSGEPLIRLLDADPAKEIAATAKVDATAVLRRLALQYVRGYREGGNARLAIYRDKDRPTFVANEFQSMIDRLPRLAADLPELKRYLLDYPRATLPDVTDFLYLAVGAVRSETHRSHQPPGHPTTPGPDRHRVEDVVTQPIISGPRSNFACCSPTLRVAAVSGLLP